MSLTGFFRAMSEAISPPIPPTVLRHLTRLDPQRIYVENVRSVLNVSAARARHICDTAVRRGVFTRKVLVLCPDGSVAASAQNETGLPATVRCWIEVDGDLEPQERRTSELQTLEVFSINA